MNPENKILPDDPRLTTYALGEMEPAEQAEFEQLLHQDTDARATVDAIRATATALGSALETEPAPANQAVTTTGTSAQDTAVREKGKVLRFPQLYFILSTAAAACFAVFFVYWSREQALREAPARHYVRLQDATVDAVKKAEAEKQAAAALAQKEREQYAAQAKAAAATAPATAPEPAVTFALPSAPEEQALARNEAPAGSKVEIPRLDEVDKPVVLPPVSSPSVTNSFVAANAVAVATPVAPPPPVPMEVASGLRDIGAIQVPADANANTAEQPIKLDSFVVSSTGKKPARTKGSIVDSLNMRGGARSDDAKHKNTVHKDALYVSSNIQPMAFAGKEAPVGDVRLRQALPHDQEFNTEAYSQLAENPFLAVAQNPLSTFSIDVDTAAYANLRRFLTSGQRPPRDAVRIEELVNYFPYRYAPPTDQTPFAASMEVASAPWTPEHRLVRIGLKGREVSDAARPKANLVFLLDVSGSMNMPNKLPLVKESLHLLVNKLRPDDRVAIIVYAGASGMALPSTPAREQARILSAIDQLRPEGSTNGAAGIQLAYDVAKANFITGGVNRVILATDGDFNVGTTSEGELTSLIEEKAKSGVFLTVLGFGMGNYKDSTLEKLADKGNGNYAYIDTAAEARKSLVEQAGGTLVTIAKDVKIQVEFNPAQVQAYRLIGYENRVLRNEDFNNDKVDAGEIGAGHTVTALYELVPAGAPAPETGSVDALKYQKVEAKPANAYAASGELLTLKVRYKEPAGDVSKKLEFPLGDSDHVFEQATADFKFAASVAAFGMILRDSPHKGAATLADVTGWAQSGLENDVGGYRSEFIGLIRLAEAAAR